jgi:hypothetical protein
VDDFMAVHNVEALDELGRLLAKLDRHRPVRGHRRLSTPRPALEPEAS